MTPSKDATYLAFDLGASSGRAILGRIGPGGTVELEEAHRFANAPVEADGGLFWDLDGLFAHVVEGMRMAAEAGPAPRSIGVDAWGVDFGLLGADGGLLARPRCYRDARNAGMSRRVAERIGADRLHARTGSMHQDHDSLCQLVAVAEHEPELLERARRLLFMPGLLRRLLCGAEGADRTFASTSQMYDAAAGEWATDILAELNLPADILPEVVDGPAVVGTLGERLQWATGLGPVPIVAGCGHDTGAAFGTCLPEARPLVAGADELPPPEELVVISSGTWSILGVFVDGQLPPGTLDPARFGYEANPDGSLRLIRNLTGAWLIEQCRRSWAPRGVDCAHEALTYAAGAAADEPDSSAILDTASPDFIHPPDMPEAIRRHCRQTDQPEPRTPGQVAHVIFASLAESYRATIDLLTEKTGRRPRAIYILGGLARNAYLNDLTAARTGLPVIPGPAEATALGNVIVQRQAVG
jgi:rhamnulokinase